MKQQIVPDYFASIKERLMAIQQQADDSMAFDTKPKKAVFLSGGTDLFVQRPEEMIHATAHHLFDHSSLQGIQAIKDRIEIGGSVTVTELMESPVMQNIFPKLYPHLKLVSSTPIRNMATVAGNLVNASPIGDLTVWLLALNATVVLRNGQVREIPLRDLYQGYKTLAKTTDEILEKIYFQKPTESFHFNFEKVSKRTCLDIASVNSAISLRIEKEVVREAHVSAGGVAPIPLYLKKTSKFLTGKTLSPTAGISESLLSEATEILQTEISPISDVRGSSDYKRLLLKQLFRAHFIEIFAEP